MLDLNSLTLKMEAQYNRCTCVKERMHWASAIEWPVVRHSRDKKIKGFCFERVKLCTLRVARRVQQL